MQIKRLYQCAYQVQIAHRNELRGWAGQWLNQQQRRYSQWRAPRTLQGGEKHQDCKGLQLSHPTVLDHFASTRRTLNNHQDTSGSRLLRTAKASQDVKTVSEIPKKSEEARTWCPEMQPLILNALKQLGFDKPTEIQALSLPTTLRGKSTLLLAETGTGKTLSFLIPGEPRIGGIC